MNPSAPIRLAIAGCGFAARKIHAPRLSCLPELFQIVGVADPVQESAQALSEYFGGIPEFDDVIKMLDSVEAEALAIFTPLHSELIKAGIDRNLDIFVEKPFCETTDDAAYLAKQAKEKERVVMVGTMRVFDPAIEALTSLIRTIEPLRWVELRDYCGLGYSAAGSGQLVAKTLQSALPLPQGRPRNALQTMLLEFIHDISILRGVFGTPITCRHASLAADGWSVTGQLELPGDIPCLFAVAEYGLPKVNHFEVVMTIAGENGLVRAQFGDANTPGGGKTIIEHIGANTCSYVSDPFLEEWITFAQAVSTRQIRINSADDGAKDVCLAWEIAKMGMSEKATE